MKVLDLQAKRHIEIPQQPLHERGQVSCICWVTRQDDEFETLCYGNALGFFIFLEHSPTEVSCATAGVKNAKIRAGYRIALRSCFRLAWRGAAKSFQWLLISPLHPSAW